MHTGIIIQYVVATMKYSWHSGNLWQGKVQNRVASSRESSQKTKCFVILEVGWISMADL